jgi:hypothetical protein
MRGKLTFLAGATAGFVLGTRAGREKYEQLVAAARKLMDSPTVHEATGVVQAQATKLYDQGKDTLANSKLASRFRHSDELNGSELTDDKRQHMSANSF